MNMQDFTEPKSLNVHYEFECLECQNKFPVYFAYLKNKDEIRCPNCGQILPSNVLKNIKDSITCIEDALVSLDQSNEYNSGWSLSVQWNNLLNLPEKPGKYKHLIESADEDYSPFNISNI